MARDYSVDARLISIRARCYENTGALSDSKILAIMNDEMESYLVPFLEAARTDLFTTHVDVPVIGNQSAYYLPNISLGNRIRDIGIINADGSWARPLNELDLDLLVRGNPSFNLLQVGNCTGYYFEGEQIKLYPVPASTDGTSMRIYYSRRPSELVLTTSVQAVTASSPTGGNTRLTVASSTAFTTGQSIELVSALPPFSVPVATTVANVPDGTHVDITGLISAPASTLLAAGAYYLCPAGQAPVPTGVPAEFWTGLFSQWMVARLMAARGDTSAYNKAAQDVRESEGRAKLLLRQRNKGDVHQLASTPYRFKGGLGGLWRGR